MQFYNGNLSASTNMITLNFKVINTSGSPIPLANIKLRYYYTVNGTQTQNFYCDYSPVGSANITGSFVSMFQPRPGADTYLEVGFTSSAGSLAAGGSAIIMARTAKTDWTIYNQTDDYSYNPSATTYVDWPKVTGYVSGVLQWGIEP